jgi:hypothetical protein
MDHEEDPLLRWLLPSRSEMIISWIGLIALFCMGFWQVFVIVSDHWGGKPGDGRVSDGLCLASTPDAAGCRVPPGETD